MKRILCLCLFFSLSPVQGAENFKAEFDKFYEAGKYDQALVVATKWEQAEPNLAQPPISQANCYFGMAYQEGIQVSTKPAKEGDLTLTDPSTGKVAGSIGRSIHYDPVFAKKGLAILERSVKKFPERVDVWLGMAQVHQNMGEFPALLDVVTRACRYASAHPDKLMKNNREKLEDPTRSYLPESIQGLCGEYAQSGEPGDFDRFEQLSQVLIQYYPKHPYGYDNVGAYYAHQGQKEKAIGYFLKASKLAPTDSLEWMNLGNTYKDLGQKKKARDCYQKVLKLNNNPDEMGRAKEMLQVLDTPAKK